MGLGKWMMAAAAAVGVALFAAPAAFAQAPAPSTLGAGEAVFAARCKSCHEPAIDRAPNRVALSAMPPAQIVTALTSGAMTPMAQGLSDADKQAVAAYLTTAQAAPDAHP
ncbi:MAG: c-type cytochrome, partial [Phenylobacterium sp.]